MFKNVFDTMTPEVIILYGLQLFLLLFVLRILFMIIHLVMNKQLAMTSVVYNTSDLGACQKKILILGDSTAVGTGASSPNDTIAGRLSHDFPESCVINLGKNGGLIADVQEQIERIAQETFDMIIISAGGNDVWHFTSLSSIQKTLQVVLPHAVRMSNHRVLFFVYNNIGDAPIFPHFIQSILKGRCDRVQETIRAMASTLNIPIIDLFSNEEHNPFMQNPKELFARDGIHPSSRGYMLWYNRMWREMTKNGFRYD